MADIPDEHQHDYWVPYGYCRNCGEELSEDECERRVNNYIQLEADVERLQPLAEAHVKDLEVQYDQSDDGSHYQMWQDAKKAFEGSDDG